MAEKQYKFGGLLVFEGRDENGRIQIVDSENTVRSMYFDSTAKQSAINLNAPDQLILEYTQAMMASLLFAGKVETVLILGLGGGSIPKFLHRHFSSCSIDVVECRELVVDLSYTFFGLPMENRLCVHRQHAEDFLENCPAGRYDLIFVDIFDKMGVCAAVSRRRFSALLQSTLRSNGVIAMNLWTQPKQLYCKTRADLQDCFGNRVMELPIAGRINRILLAVDAARCNINRKQLEKRAWMFQGVLGIDFPLLLERLFKFNH